MRDPCLKKRYRHELQTLCCIAVAFACGYHLLAPRYTGEKPPMNLNKEAKCYSFKRLFWSLDRSEFPSFADLLGLGQSLDEGARPVQGELENHARTALDAISDACHDHDVRPLITELALIADRRMLSDGLEYFVSFVGVDNALESGAGEAALIMAKYIDALSLMKQNGGEPIVPHPHLYSMSHEQGTPPSNNGMFILNEQSLTCPTGLSDKLGKANYGGIRGLRYKFKPIASPTQRVSDRIKFYFDTLLDSLAAQPGLVSSQAFSLLRQSAFIVIPFIRPHYQSAVFENEDALAREAWQAGAPAGVLFSFITATKSNNSPPEVDRFLRLGRDLQSLLSIASLRESYSALSAVLSIKELFGSMTHGTVNTIRSIRSEQIGLILANDPLPTTPDAFRIEEIRNNKEQYAKPLIQALHRAVLGEDTACALLSFAEIQIWDGKIRPKFQSPGDISLREIVSEAHAMVCFNANGIDYYPIELDMVDSATIPKHYLDRKIIRGILCEILLNASGHGARSTEGVVSLQCRVSSIVNGISCVFSNRVSDDIRISKQGNLVRLRQVLKSLRGIDLRFPEFVLKGDEFIVTLDLGPLTAETSDLQPKQRLINPVYERDTTLSTGG